MTNAVNIAQQGSNNTTFRNRIINGAMVISQRTAGAAVTVNDNPAVGLYPTDRFLGQGTAAAGVFTAQQSTSTPPAGFTNFLRMTTTTASASPASSAIYAVSQIIEGYNIADLGFGAAGASTVTLSFWVRSSLTGTFAGSLKNGQSYNRSYPFTYTISAANTWEYKTITVVGDTTGTWQTTNLGGLIVYWDIGCGSSYLSTANSWQAGNLNGVTGSTRLISTLSATLDITGVQLEAGTTASPFEYRLYSTELALCQRYYEKSFETGTAPASAGSAAGAFEFAQQVAASAQQYGPSCKYAVVKRSTPTVTFYNWNAAGNQAVNVVTGATTTSLALRAGQSGVSSYSITFIAPAGTSVGQGLSVQWTADSEI